MLGSPSKVLLKVASEAEAREAATRMEKLNPGKTFVAMELKKGTGACDEHHEGSTDSGGSDHAD